MEATFWVELPQGNPPRTWHTPCVIEATKEEIEGTTYLWVTAPAEMAASSPRIRFDLGHWVPAEGPACLLEPEEHRQIAEDARLLQYAAPLAAS